MQYSKYFPCHQDYEEKNEINLDDWDPSAMNNDEDDIDDNVDTIFEEDSDDSSENILPAAVVIENPPIPDTLDLATHAPVAEGSSHRGSAGSEGRDYSSQPWINPAFQKGGETMGHCSTWPIRKYAVFILPSICCVLCTCV